jgi:ABC-type Na+ efflux pump permease subunit
MNKNSNPFTSLYTFDENGQLKYKDGALKKLSDISAKDDTGKPKKTVKEQYDAILAMNSDFAKYMKYDSSGKEIEYDENGKPKDEAAYASAVQAFWDKIDADKEEMQSLHDSINEHKEAVLAAQEK